jgi:hypothetical protein
MQRHSLFFAAVAFLLLLVLTAAGTTGPSGSYCGSYSFGLVKGKAVFSPTTFSIHLDAFGKSIECANEAYSYDPATSVLSVPGAADTKDCLGQLLSDNGLSLAATFDAAGNSASLDLGLASIELDSC